MDRILGPLMDSLRAEACRALDDTLGGAPACACTLMPGQEAPADFCTCSGRNRSCGMAWVRLDRIVPTAQSFPAQDTRASCTSVLSAVLEVGVLRCQPAMSPSGQPPSVEAQTQAALVEADDAMALHRAMRCTDALMGQTHALGLYTPRAGGDCGGGAWMVTVQLLRR